MRINNEPAEGGHAMCIIGYQDDNSVPGGGYFIIRNSWDDTWGSECPFGAGNGTIPYQYLTDEGWEAATIPASQAVALQISPQNNLPTITIEAGGKYNIAIR